MNKKDWGIYIVHAAFWSAFGVTLVVLRLLGGKSDSAPDPASLAKDGKTAPYSRALLVFHMVAFFTMYFQGWAGRVHLARAGMVSGTAPRKLRGHRFGSGLGELGAHFFSVLAFPCKAGFRS